MRTDHINQIRGLNYALRCGMPDAADNWKSFIKKWSDKIYKKIIDKNLSTDNLRQEVFVPIDTDKNFDNLYSLYQTYKNYIILNGPDRYKLDENRIKYDLLNNGGDPDQLNISINKYEPEKSRIIIRGSKDLHSWERKYYFVELAIRIKELQKTHYLTVWNLSYQGIDMEIYRFHKDMLSEGKYYVFPARQLSQCPIEIDEKLFFQFDIVTILLDFSKDYQQRNDIYTFLSKRLKLRIIELNAIGEEGFNPVFWDEKRISKASKEYVRKGYDLSTSITYLHRSFMKSLREYINKYSCSGYYGESNIFYQEHHRGKWTVNFYWGACFHMVTKCDSAEYTMNFSSYNPNPYPIKLYLDKVEEYGNRWNQLTDYCKKEYLKYKRINLLEQNLK